MGLVPRETEQTVHGAIVEEQPLSIISKIHGMDLAPALSPLHRC
jgi:hypothetical protein